MLKEVIIKVKGSWGGYGMIERMEPRIIFEDGDILVLDKPAGMVVNRAESVKGETVQEWVEGYLKIRSTKHEILNKSKITNSNIQNRLGFRNWDLEFSQRAGIVHRLDKETSGLLLVAKTPKAFENLQKQFKERVVEKRYIALVHGEVKPEEGVIRAPVGRLPWNRERFGILPGGREAETGYRVLGYYAPSALGSPANDFFGFHSLRDETLDLTRPPRRSQGKRSKIGRAPRVLSLNSCHPSQTFSLLELFPKTGRTHQVRIHLKYLGHPIVGDAFYAGRKTARQDRIWCPRLFLHAVSLKFKHPQTGEWRGFTAELPKDLEKILLILQKANSKS